MSNKLVTLGDACQQLGIARSTLTRRMERLGIKPRHNPLDQRESYISSVDVERLNSAYKSISERVVSVNSRSLSRQELEDKVAALEEEIKRLKQSRIAQLSRDALQGESDVLIEKRVLDYHPRAERQARISTSGDTMPENWIPLYTLCDIHNIAPSNVSRAIRKGELPKPHIGEWVYHGTSARNGLDPAMQTAILAWHAKKHGK